MWLRSTTFVTLVFLTHSLFAQQDFFYVIIGSYATEGNARAQVDRAHTLNVPAVYAFDETKGRFYVFVRTTSDKETARETMKGVRQEGFRDAWIFQGSLGGYAPAVANRNPDPVPARIPVQPTVVADVASEEVQAQPEEPLTEQPSEPVTDRETDTHSAASAPPGRPFVFRLFNEVTGNPVVGQVRLLEAEKSNQYRGYAANEAVQVVPPVNRSGRWYLMCDVIGFKQLKKHFEYASPESERDVTFGPGQEVIMSLRLSRVKKGDYIELNEVRFVTNSNIMTPESNRELGELVAMMQENPAYRIRIHGHTNGKQGRDIVAAIGDQDLFTVTPANKRIPGTARELSELRASTVKKYLVSKGIEDSRISVRGEGGNEPAFDPKGTMAASNDRVEVEITRH